MTVPETICPLSETAKQRFLDCLHLMHSDPTPQSDYGVSKFLQAKVGCFIYCRTPAVPALTYLASRAHIHVFLM